MEAVKAAAKFLRSEGAYLQIRSMLNTYEGEVVRTAGEIQRKITGTQIEMGYQRKRAKSLEELSNARVTIVALLQQVVDPENRATNTSPLPPKLSRPIMH